MKKLLCLIMLLSIMTISGTALAQEAPSQTLPPQAMMSASVPAPTIHDEDVYAIIGLAVLTTAFLFLFMLIPSIVCGVAAHRKGLSGFWFFIFSFIFTPIIGFLAVIAFQKKTKPISVQNINKTLFDVEDRELSNFQLGEEIK
jgi:cytochrome b561